MTAFFRFLFSTLPRWVIGIMILAGIAINIASVISRYLLGNALFWVEEMLVFIVIWSVFIGIIAVTYEGGHLRMDLVSARIGKPWRTVVNGLTLFALIGCCGFVAFQSYQIVLLMDRNAQVSIAAGIPMAVPHAALLVGFVLMALAAVARLRAYLAGRFDT